METTQKSYLLVLIEDKMISLSGKCLADFDLPTPGQRGELSSDVVKELNYDTAVLEAQVNKMAQLLLPEQRQVYETILRRVNSGEGGIFFLDAPGGKGNTFVLNLLLAQLRKYRNIALAVASSGIAATLLNGGQTAHSVFKLPLNLESEDTPTCNITKNSGRGILLQQCKLVVWDECTMAHKHALEALNRSLQDIRDNQALIGGVVVLLAGDFRQTLPIRFFEEFSHPVATEDKLIMYVFPNLEVNINNAEWLCERAVLSPKNEWVNKINKKILDMIAGDSKVYTSIDTVMANDDSTAYPVEFLNSLALTGVPSHKLELKVGVVVLLMRNLDAPRLCNGTRLRITELGSNIIKATIITGAAKGESVLIPRIPIIPSNLLFEFGRLPFPLKLAFTMTINKSQGQTLKVAGIHLGTPCFSHGQ